MSFIIRNGVKLSPDEMCSGRDGLEHWQEVVCKQYVELDCDLTKDYPVGEFHGSLRTRNSLGPLRFSEVIASPQIVDRTTSHVSKSAEEDFLISFQLRNDCLLQQGGRLAHLQPGSFALYGSAEPYRLMFEKPFHQFILQISGSELRRYVSDPERLVAKTYEMDQGFGPVARKFMYTLVNEQSTHQNVDEGAIVRVRDTVSSLSTNLLELLIHIMLPTHGLALGTDCPQEALKNRILEFISRNLFDPRLNNERIAEAAGISSRYLYKLFAEDELSLRERILSERLNVAQQLLLSAIYEKISIEAVALRVGFSSASHFSKAFKAKFGVAPGKLKKDQRRIG